MVAVHRGDGLGIAPLRRAGVKLLILSTEQNPVVAARARKLGVPVLHGIDRKDLAARRGASRASTRPRVPTSATTSTTSRASRLVGWPVAVPDAHATVRAAAASVTHHARRRGAIREICRPAPRGPPGEPT